MKSVLVELRKAEFKDIARIIRLDEACGLNVWSAKSYENLLRRKDTQFILAVSCEEPHTVLGFYIASRTKDELEILKIAIDPTYQRQGIGQRLLEYGLHQAQKSECLACFLEVRPSNRAALQFYKKNDFEIVNYRRNYYINPIEDALIMKKQLA